MLDKAKKSINQENTSTITLPQSTPMQKPTLKPTEKPTFAPNPTKIPLSIVEFRLGDKGHLDCGEKNCLLAVTEKEYYEVLQQVNKTKDGVKLAELILNKKVIQIKNNPEVKILANEEDLLIKCGIQEGDYQFSIVYVSKESIIPAD